MKNGKTKIRTINFLSKNNPTLMNTYDVLNKQLNNEMQDLAEKINSGEYTERDRNRLAAIMYPKLKYFIWKFFNDQIETEEVLHNTLFKIFKGLESYSDKFRFTTWIYTIAKNEALLHQHKITTQVTVRLDNLVQQPIIEDTARLTLEREEYLDCLYSMTQREMFALPSCVEKDILIDKEINLLRGNDIADKYDMNLNTVKTKIRKARKMLRDRVLENNPHMREQINEFF
jgi:RNA polymerase sigma-70 factor, ECF subfamily